MTVKTLFNPARVNPIDANSGGAYLLSLPLPLLTGKQESFPHQELYDRIMAFSFDGAFVQRLMREMKRPEAFVLQAIAEYRRFLFLKQTVSHSVVPSRRVDQVWHLHLLYTRSYWDDLCTVVLQEPLHHHPGTSSGTPDDYFWQGYEETLKSYGHVFRQVPPVEFWPPAKVQFRRSRRSAIQQKLLQPMGSMLSKGLSKSRLLVSSLLIPGIRVLKGTTVAALLGGITYLIVVQGPIASIGWMFVGLIGVAPLLFVVALGIDIQALLLAQRILQTKPFFDPITRVETAATADLVARLGRCELRKFICICYGTVVSSIFVWVGLGWGAALCIAIACLFIYLLLYTVVRTMLKAMGLLKSLPQGFSLDLQHSTWLESRIGYCQTCTNRLEPFQIASLLTEKEQFAKSIKSVDVNYKHAHCPTCSPMPTRENVGLKVTAKQGFSSCPKCETIAFEKKAPKVIREATTHSVGKELILHRCGYCKHTREEHRDIPRLSSCHDHHCYG
jgi:hypothetical protein